MSRRFSFTTFMAFLGLWFAGNFAAAAQQVDLWTVPNVPVDGSAASPSAAKETALSVGRQRAWTEIFRRLTPSAVWPSQPPIANEVLEPMVKSFDIANEKHSSTRYLATVTYVFSAAAVRDTLRKTGVRYSESTSKPVLVIALSGAAWQPESFWGRAWSNQTLRGRLVPVAVPVGDAQDLATLATVSSASDWGVVKPLADRYGAGSVLVAAQTKTANGIQVSMTHIKPDGRAPKGSTFPRQGTEDDTYLAARAASQIADTLQEEWKRTTSVDFGAQTSVEVDIPFSSLADWVTIRRTLDGTRLIQKMQVEEMNASVARVRLDYVGKFEQLQTALAQTNFFLTADDKGNWTLSRNASTATAPSPNPVVP
ncbi:MAG: DUF2066 domain-containing protein [Micropepsaceae bacterium]